MVYHTMTRTTKSTSSRAALICLTLLAAVSAGAIPVQADTLDDAQQGAADELATPVACLGHDDLDGPLCPTANSGCEDTAATYGLSLEEVYAILTASGADCDSGEAKCQGGWWEARQWEIKGEYAGGSGEVKFFVQCGPADHGDYLWEKDWTIECTVGKAGIGCADGIHEDEGEFGCWHRVLEDDPRDVVGKCVDPANPKVVYSAIPFGSEEVYNVFAHAEVIEDSAHDAVNNL